MGGRRGRTHRRGRTSRDDAHRVERAELGVDPPRTRVTPRRDPRRRVGDSRRRRLGLARRGRRRSGRRRHRAERSLVGTRCDLGGGAHRPRLDGSRAAPAQAQRRGRASRTVRSRCAGCRRSSMRAGCRGSPRACPVSCACRPASRCTRALVRSTLTGMVDAICRDSARRLELPAPPPAVRTVADVAEAVIARLDGSAFDAPMRIAGEIGRRTEQWALFGHRRTTSGWSYASILPTTATRGISPFSRRARRASSYRSSARS